MGKEASGVWGQLSDGESEGKLLWEPPKLIFRGAYRGIYQGHALKNVRAEGDDLVLSDGTRFTLEAGQAEKWVHAILNPPSRLDKLGVKPGMTVVVDGVEDEAFIAELETRVALDEAEEGIDLLFLGAEDLADFDRLEDWAGALAAKGAVWVVARKGKGAPLKDAEILEAVRGLGFTDTKVCAFSSTHTALRFVKRKGG
ncbi:MULTISPECIES: DUF3052 family protein [Caulobacter]|jgi:hypothetical protein|uniref:DUF3052 domain-containing protein n=1 Tax=Caulobacter vibrioides OR37 TaxID=1292034 RepID=R0E4E2_CAUVI|nr:MULTISPECIES: DUF3052 family protein [Caulobacter]ENZ80468.1 hypothetical protein OR37_03680 [Caulobacter vibrioides OR37]MBQ1563636.1 DUF3052 family protein [Caulobacter sp.]